MSQASSKKVMQFAHGYQGIDQSSSELWVTSGTKEERLCGDGRGCHTLMKLLIERW